VRWQLDRAHTDAATVVGAAGKAPRARAALVHGARRGAKQPRAAAQTALQLRLMLVLVLVLPRPRCGGAVATAAAEAQLRQREDRALPRCAERERAVHEVKAAQVGRGGGTLVARLVWVLEAASVLLLPPPPQQLQLLQLLLLLLVLQLQPAELRARHSQEGEGVVCRGLLGR
jgi:hypothetical protein